MAANAGISPQQPQAVPDVSDAVVQHGRSHSRRDSGIKHLAAGEVANVARNSRTRPRILFVRGTALSASGRRPFFSAMTVASDPGQETMIVPFMPALGAP
jgi:hypothetical protein